MARGILALAFLATSLSLAAQKSTLSPFSRLGLGDLQGDYQSWSRSGGRAAVSLAPENQVNLTNPASVTFAERPIFNINAETQFIELSNASEKQSLENFTVNSFNYAFPLGDRMGMGFGLKPFSRVGYRIVDRNTGDTLNGRREFEGDGSLNEAFLYAGAQLINHGDSTVLSIGARTSFLFGTLRRSRAYYLDDTRFFNSRTIERNIYRDFLFSLGGHFQFYPNPQKPVMWHVGLTFQPEMRINRKFDRLSETFITNSLGNDISMDTVSFAEDRSGYVTLPMAVRVGLGFTWKDRLVVNADYGYRDWSGLRTNDTRKQDIANLQADHQLGVGLAYTPNTNQLFNASVFQFMTYRTGFYYQSGYLATNDAAVKDLGMTFGLDIPLRKSRSGSSIQIGVELGQRGDVQKNLIQEKYAHLMFGVNLRPNFVDRWFYKRKYD